MAVGTLSVLSVLHPMLSQFKPTPIAKNGHLGLFELQHAHTPGKPLLVHPLDVSKSHIALWLHVGMVWHFGALSLVKEGVFSCNLTTKRMPSAAPPNTADYEVSGRRLGPGTMFERVGNFDCSGSVIPRQQQCESRCH